MTFILAPIHAEASHSLMVSGNCLGSLEVCVMYYLVCRKPFLSPNTGSKKPFIVIPLDPWSWLIANLCNIHRVFCQKICLSHTLGCYCHHGPQECDSMEAMTSRLPTLASSVTSNEGQQPGVTSNVPLRFSKNPDAGHSTSYQLIKES